MGVGDDASARTGCTWAGAPHGHSPPHPRRGRDVVVTFPPHGHKTDNDLASYPTLGEPISPTNCPLLKISSSRGRDRCKAAAIRRRGHPTTCTLALSPRRPKTVGYYIEELHNRVKQVQHWKSNGPEVRASLPGSSFRPPPAQLPF